MAKIIRPALLAIFFVLIPIIYSLIKLNDVQKLSVDQIMNETSTNLRNIFNILEQQDLIGYFIGIATILILGVLFIAAIRRRFEKRFRHQ